ncbi:MAG: hypothetical protein C5B50_02340 [Verrucomicrobia bacterium]|nr:MAG: hypothetical protein C5B50_02340 [Verrucomicrobiota bacterium]
MILSYHGLNGFRFLDPMLPQLIGPNRAPYVERPIRLLANVEHAMKLRRLNRLWAQSAKVPPPFFTNLIGSRYGQDYQTLIQTCKTNNVQLVLATYSMAVTARSDPEVINFYRQTFPFLLRYIKANEAHSLLVAQLARSDPSIRLVDTQPVLDGRYWEFTDLVHLTQDGRQRVAEAFFNGIKAHLEKALAEPEGARVQNAISSSQDQ